MKRLIFFSLILTTFCSFASPVELGVDVFFKGEYKQKLSGKKVGLISNHTGLNKDLVPTLDLLKKHARDCKVVALFSPEHGWQGSAYAFEKVADSKTGRLPIYSLHGATRRPTETMLKGIDVLIFDIQDVGVRPYTYASTLCYVMEEASKKGIEVIVLDRPNPMGGRVVDGAMLDKNWRSFIGYLNVPYCHGMTIGELALFFNKEYKVGCRLHVVAMKGWKREMSFAQTGLTWVPTSPHLPEQDTPLYYATTGMMGELGFVSIGVGYTLPFKVVGAPWINANEYASQLNKQKLEGVRFIPFHFKPFYGMFKDKVCGGVLIKITDPTSFKPQKTQCVLLGLLKSLYPKKVTRSIKALPKGKKDLFCKASGSKRLLNLMDKEEFPSWKMVDFQKKSAETFPEIRERYLLYK